MFDFRRGPNCPQAAQKDISFGFSRVCSWPRDSNSLWICKIGPQIKLQGLLAQGVIWGRLNVGQDLGGGVRGP